MKDPTKLAEYVYGLTDELHKLGLEMIKESLESMDTMLQKSPIRLKHWVVEAHSNKQLTTSLGDVIFSKTLFTNKETGKSEYLLDWILGINPNISLQFREKKGDLEENENHQKNNCMIVKLVYIYEGIEKTNYERQSEEKQKQILKNWRKSWKDILPGIRERMEEAKTYILSNWTAAKIRLKHKDGVKGSSTEGHVSHVLSSRMSSRPMGWSVTGATKMAQLRAYYLNGGDMLELVRYQEKELPKAVGAEYDLLSSSQIIASERNRHGELGKYVEAMTHSLPLQNKKIVYFNSHIWGL